MTTSAFALPVIAAFKLELFRQLHLQLEISGNFPAFDALHLFFVNLLGSVVIVWSVLRVRSPEARFGYYDSIARFLFSFAMAWALLIGNVSALLCFFLVPEFIWGIVQLYFYNKSRE